MKWFRHQADAHADSKLKRVRKRYGAEGYALYWYCLELIAGKVCSTNITFSIEDDAELIGCELGIDSRRVEEIMLFMVQQGLFEESAGRVSCLKMAKYMDERYSRDVKLVSLIRKQQGKPSSAVLSSDSLKTDSRQSEDCLGLPVVPDQTRPDQTKGKRARFAPPTPTEVAAYAAEKNIPIDAERFVDFYAAKGWVVGKSPMKDWRAAVRTWSRPSAPQSGHWSTEGLVI
jgi:hypothetical protein